MAAIVPGAFPTQRISELDPRREPPDRTDMLRQRIRSKASTTTREVDADLDVVEFAVAADVGHLAGIF